MDTLMVKSKRTREQRLNSDLDKPDRTPILLIALAFVFLFMSAASAQTDDIRETGEEIKTRLSIMDMKLSVLGADEKQLENLSTGVNHMRLILDALIEEAERIKEETTKQMLKRAVF